VKLYGFWRSLATYRVRVALALKGVKLDQPEIPVDILQGRQFDEAYRKLNPQSVVPALIVDGGPPLFQSMAILEYLEETHPKPALLPADARGRARVRGLAQICGSDGHPLQVPRIRKYLAQELGLDEAAVQRWVAHWSLKALQAVESHLAGEPETGRYCHGDAPTLADVCVASQVIAARD
jgi:maleylacetoacetate isomerase/maleylpyruvate isomerase